MLNESGGLKYRVHSHATTYMYAHTHIHVPLDSEAITMINCNTVEPLIKDSWEKYNKFILV